MNRIAYMAAIVCALAIAVGGGLGYAVSLKAEGAEGAPVQALEIEREGDAELIDCHRKVVDGNETLSCAPVAMTRIFKIHHGAVNGTPLILGPADVHFAEKVQCERTEDNTTGRVTMRCTHESGNETVTFEAYPANASAHTPFFVAGMIKTMPDKACERLETENGIQVRCVVERKE